MGDRCRKIGNDDRKKPETCERVKEIDTEGLTEEEREREGSIDRDK
jgi:hypothetical protein